MLDDIALFSAVLCHYVSDGHVPLHANKNYDGQLSGQNGAHSRFESELFERYTAQLSVSPRPQPPVTDPRGEMFRVLLDSYRLAEPVLAADRAAARGRDFYDDGFFAAFKPDAFPIVDQRIADAIAASPPSSPAPGNGPASRRSRLSLSRPPRRVAKPVPPAGTIGRNLQRRAFVPLVTMQVFLIPIGRDAYEPYFEAPDDAEDDDAGAGTSWFGRLRLRLREMLREAEAERHQRHESGVRAPVGSCNGCSAR